MKGLAQSLAIGWALLLAAAGMTTLPGGAKAAGLHEPFVDSAEATIGGAVLSDVKQAAAGSQFVLALKHDGTVWTWGSNLAMRPSTTAVQLSGLTEVESVTVSDDYGGTAAAVKKDGTAWIFGQIRYGRFGGQTYTPDHPAIFRKPAKIEGLGDVKDVRLGTSFALALKKDGSVWAWGGNEYGTLGDGTTYSRATPAKVPGLPAIASIAVHGDTAFAIDRYGKLWYWGAPSWSAYATGERIVVTKPRVFAKLDRIRAVTGDTVLLRTDGSVWSFGDAYGGMLGRDFDSADGYAEPKPIPELKGIADVSCDYLQCLALDRNHKVWSWGNNSFRQIGDGKQPHRFDHPVPLEGHEAVGIVSGVRATFLLKQDGTLWGAGLNGNGQIGQGVLGPWRGEEGFGVRPYEENASVITRYRPVLEAPAVLVNGRQIDAWAMQAGGRVYVSIRAALEAMAYRIAWDADEKLAVATKDGQEADFRVAESSIVLNGQAVRLSRPMYVVRGDLLVPIREFGAAFGWSTTWEADANRVRIAEQR